MITALEPLWRSEERFGFDEAADFCARYADCEDVEQSPEGERLKRRFHKAIRDAEASE